MTGSRHNARISIILLMLNGAIIACSPAIRYNILSTLFDDVPDPNKSSAILVMDSTSTDSIKTLVVEEKINKPLFTIHDPYSKKKCNSCHSANNFSKLLHEEPNLCFQCHDNSEHTLSFGHGPVKAGKCTVCHNPHRSKINGLLLAEGNELCYSCHNQSSVARNDKHENMEAVGCMTCHNSHSSNNWAMLEVQSCTQCHQSFQEDYSYSHGPSGAGYCGNCHDSHDSEAAYMIKSPVEKLCLDCHNELEISKTENHQTNKICTECHNPHGGENSFILN
jgi:predicted CXXCH cytochrome family protein